VEKQKCGAGLRKKSEIRVIIQWDTCDVLLCFLEGWCGVKPEEFGIESRDVFIEVLLGDTYALHVILQRPETPRIPRLV
jgi:hypothetical protein